MSGATSNCSISSLINQCQTLEELTQGALIKAFRAATGQMKVLTDTTVTNSATLVTEAEFSFPVKANYKYIMYGTLMFNCFASAGPLGNLKFQFTAPAHTTNFFADGQLWYVVSGSAGTATQLGQAANNPFAATNVPSVQTFNNPLSFNVATAANTALLTFTAEVIPAVDDIVTIQFAQASAVAGSTILQRGSEMNLLCLASSRRAPNVV